MVLKILLIDDNDDSRRLIEAAFARTASWPHELTCLHDYQSGLSELLLERHDLYLINPGLSGGRGIELAMHAVERKCRAAIILAAVSSTTPPEVEALAGKAFDFITRQDLNPPRLEQIVKDALARKRERQRRENENNLDRFIAGMSARFINLAPEGMEQEITATIRGLTEYLGVERCFIIQASQSLNCLSITHEWCALGVPAAKPLYQERSAAALSWFIRQLKDAGSLEPKAIYALPCQSGAIKDLLLSLGEQWLALAAMVHGDEPIGALGFSSSQPDKQWSKDTSDVLKAAAEILANALAQKQVQSALRQSEMRYRMLVDNLWEGIVYCDLNETILNVNSRMAELTGYAADEMIGQKVPQLFLPSEEHEKFKARTLRRLSGIAEQYHLPLIRKDGSRFWAQVSATAVPDEEGRIIGTLAAISDISQRLETERELEFQRQFLRLVIDTSPNMIFVTDAEGRFTLVNHSFAQSYGLQAEEMVGKTDADVHPDPHEVEMFASDNKQVLETHQTIIIPERLTLEPRSGRTIWCQTIRKPLFMPDGKSVQVLSVLTDISERKRAEEEAFRLHRQLLQSQKMEAIGQLAAGVAHDLNNALGAVVGHLQLLKLGSADRSAEINSVDVALAGCERALSMIDHLLGFSRQGKYNVKPVAIRQMVDETVEFLSRVIGQDYEITCSEPSNGLYVNADAGQLQQALTNLILNAKQAMPGGGKIRFVFARRIVEAPQRFNAKAKPGCYAVLSVCDEGVGIPAQNIDKVFEPFFTTKTEQGGTGLGLSMVYGIMQNHGGWVEVESKVGHGAVFSLCLPLIEQVQLETAAMLKPSPEKRSGMILVIDDEPILIDLMQKFLEMSGFASKGFVTGEDAVNWYGKNHADVDLIILDMKMPKMDGRTCYERLIKINPQARVAILSGYIQDAAVQDLMSRGALRFFQKPLKYPELVQWVIELLGVQPGDRPQ